MIIEGLLTTQLADGRPHVAPMGPVVSPDLAHWTLRPFQSSTTFRLLREHPIAIFHVVDDVLPIVRAALNLPHEFAYTSHPQGGAILEDSCRWFRLEVTDWNVADVRSEATARVHSSGHLRDFWGWNRAKHAVLEATILATRVHMLSADLIRPQLQALQSAVVKTAGPRELQAWEELQAFFEAID